MLGGPGLCASGINVLLVAIDNINVDNISVGYRGLSLQNTYEGLTGVRYLFRVVSVREYK